MNEKKSPKVVLTQTPQTQVSLMPIHARYRWFYPIDWPQLSAVIRFRRAQGKCEGCGRPHGLASCLFLRPPEESAGRETPPELLESGSASIQSPPPHLLEEPAGRETRQTDPAATRAVAVEGDYPIDPRGPRLLASRRGLG